MRYFTGAQGKAMQESVREYTKQRYPDVDLLEPQGDKFERSLAQQVVQCGLFLKERAVYKALNGIRGNRRGGA